MQKTLKIIAGVVGMFALIEIINLFTGRSLNQFGLLPRELHALPAILSAPFLHASIGHFLSNMLVLPVFLLLMLGYGVRRAFFVHLWIVAVSGLLVWLFGRYAMHIGASGVIYGQFGFLLLAGFYRRDLVKILMSLGVGAIYGSMIFGVLPSRPFVSWEYHLFGFIAGLLAAHYFNGRQRSTRKRSQKDQ